MAVPALETRRLLLRPLEVADAVQAQPLFAQWDIVRYLADKVPWPYPPDGALTHYRDLAIPAMERGEEWHWSIRLKSAPEKLIGAIGLMKSGDTNRGFWMGRTWQGRGLMTEAADAVTDYWFETLGFPVMRIPKAAANTASRRISESRGMRVIKMEERNYVSGRLVTEIWELTAEEWRGWKRKLQKSR